MFKPTRQFPIGAWQSTPTEPPQQDREGTAGGPPRPVSLDRLGRIQAHTGTSMDPALHHLDLLDVEPYGNQPLRAGDVVAFTPPGGIQTVVHRVVAVTPRGIKTRGDSNDQADPWVLSPKDVLGRVTTLWRRHKRRQVPGGLTGRALSLAGRLQRVLDKALSFILGCPYRRLAEAALLHELIPKRVVPKVALFGAKGRSRLLLLLGRRVVGRFDPTRGQWMICRPFRLFVDEAGLSRITPLREDLPQGAGGRRDG